MASLTTMPSAFAARVAASRCIFAPLMSLETMLMLEMPESRACRTAAVPNEESIGAPRNSGSSAVPP